MSKNLVPSTAPAAPSPMRCDIWRPLLSPPAPRIGVEVSGKLAMIEGSS